MNHKPASPPSGAALRGLAFAYLGRKEYSRRDLAKKLLDTGADPTEVETLVAELAEQHYQSDARMSQMVVRANIRKGRGSARIRQDLQKHAIAPELAQELIEDTDWLRLAIDLRIKKFGNTRPSDAKEKARQFRFLQYRGFSAEVCRQALEADYSSQ